MRKLVILLLLVPTVSFGQSDTNDSRNEITFEEDAKENKLSLGWAYYGRGDGFSFVYDREFSSFFSAGIGLEEYFIEDEIELSYFLVTDFHFSRLLKIPNPIDLYQGAEIGFFDNNFEIHYYFGISTPITKKIGVFTEIGSRGVLGLYYSF
ncbi:MAG: hypothetical protein CMP52_04250 [Flavobacteriales bacterium]|nr:hypothetical protein [Candidatus Arcticimaribacter sp.]